MSWPRVTLVASLLVACASSGQPAQDSDSLRFRLSGEPQDDTARNRLAQNLAAEGAPGAALAELEILDRRSALAGPNRGLYLRLLESRASERAALRDGEGALRDMKRVLALDARRRGNRAHVAALSAGIVSSLRRADSDSRKRALARAKMLARVAPRHPLSAGLVAGASTQAAGRAGQVLVARGAMRVGRELLVRYVSEGGTDKTILRSFVRAELWWRGIAAQIPERVSAALAPNILLCEAAATRVLHHCNETIESDVARERIVELALERGWRVKRVSEAELWLDFVLHAWVRGRVDSWERVVRELFDLSTLVAEPLPANIAPTILRLAGEPGADAAWQRIREAGSEPGALWVAESTARGETSLSAQSKSQSDFARRVILAASEVPELVAMSNSAHNAADLPSLSKEEFARRFAPQAFGAAVLAELSAEEFLGDARAEYLSRWRYQPESGPASAKLAVSLAAARYGLSHDEKALARVAQAFARDAALADRLAGQFVGRGLLVATRALAVAELFYRLGDQKRYLAWSARALESAPEDAEVLLVAGLAEAANGDPDRANILISRGAGLSGRAGQVYAWATRVVRAAGQPLLAIDLAKRAVQLSPDSARDALLQDVALAQRDLRRPAVVKIKERTGSAESARRSNPDFVLAQIRLLRNGAAQERKRAAVLLYLVGNTTQGRDAGRALEAVADFAALRGDEEAAKRLRKRAEVVAVLEALPDGITTRSRSR